MAIEDLRQTERQVRALIAAGLGALANSVEGQQVHTQAAQTCMDAAWQGDRHRLYAARALATVLNGAQMAGEFNQSLLDILAGSNIPENETLMIQTTAGAAAALAGQIATAAEAATAGIAAQQDAPAVLQEAAGQIAAAPTVSTHSAQDLIDAQAAAGRTMRSL